MNLRNLGHSGLRVSPICLGTMMFGYRSDEATARRIVDRARDAGIYFIDTLVPIGHPSTPGYSDPSYPITGRPVPRR